jgi:3-oxoadipate enol-lactonase
MGGCIAQAFAARYPERTAALGLIDTTAWYGADAPAQWRERANTARDKGLSSMGPFQASRWFGDRFRAEQPALVEATTRVFLANDIDCYAATCLMLGDMDLRPGLGALTMPVAIMVGEEDYATPVAMAQALNAAIPHSSLRVLAGARHLTPIEAPAAIASGLMPLLQAD